MGPHMAQKLTPRGAVACSLVALTSEMRIFTYVPRTNNDFTTMQKGRKRTVITRQLCAETKIIKVAEATEYCFHGRVILSLTHDDLG